MNDTALLDHLVYACPDLAAATGEVEELVGCATSPGGVHLGLGTRNVLLGLGPGRYLEIIGPDPGQADPARPRPFGIDQLEAPRLVTYAVRPPQNSGGIDAYCARAAACGLDLGTPRSMQRRTPSGEVLSWQLALPPEPLFDGLVPFVIDWGLSPHPSAALAGQRVELVELGAVSSRVEELRQALADLAVADLVVRPTTPGDHAAACSHLEARLLGRRGEVLLR
jgi:hypothetical protein